MKIKYLSYILFFFTTIFFADIEDNDYEEIIVSASLLPISTVNSANAITVILGEEIDSKAIANLSDILRNVPGFAVSRSGTLGAQTQIRVRGAEANHILVLIDGIEANNSAQNDEFNWGNISASDIERIEIVKGPQSSLFGSDAVSGVINIVTKKTKENNESRGFSEYGSFNTKNNGISFGFNNKKSNIRIGLSKLLTDGENISRVGSEKDGYKINTANINYEFKLNKYLNFLFHGHKRFGINEYDSDIDFDQLIDDQNNYAKFNYNNSGIKVNYKNSKIINLEHSFFLHQSKNKNSDYKDNFLQNITTSQKHQARLVSSYTWENTSQRTSLLLEKEDERFRQEGIVYDYGEFGIFDPNQERRKSTSSIAVEHRGEINNNISFAASSRFDNNSEFKNASTSKIEFVYKITNNYKIRTALGTGSKNPTFTERFGYYTNFIGNPELEPEKSKNFELGFDIGFDNKHIFSGTFFKSTLKNEINGNAIDPITFGFTAQNIAGLSKREGFEFFTKIALQENLKLNLTYTYTDSIQPSNGRYIDELRRPRNIASMKILWKFNQYLFLNLNAQHTDKQIDIVYPTNVLLRAYTIVGLDGSFLLNDRLTLNLSINNLLDEDYEEIYGYRALGLNANAGIRYRF